MLMLLRFVFVVVCFLPFSPTSPPLSLSLLAPAATRETSKRRLALASALLALSASASTEELSAALSAALEAASSWNLTASARDRASSFLVADAAAAAPAPAAAAASALRDLASASVAALSASATVCNDYEAASAFGRAALVLERTVLFVEREATSLAAAAVAAAERRSRAEGAEVEFRERSGPPHFMFLFRSSSIPQA